MGRDSGTDKGLPEQWCITPLADLFLDPKSEIVDGPFGSNLKASEYVNSGVPILRIQNIERNLFIKKNIKHVTPQKAEKLGRHCYRSGDIILTKLGDPLGKACIMPESFPAGIVVADLVRLRLSHEYLNKKFLVHAINSPPVADQLKKLTKGTTRPRVNLGHVRSLNLKLPPKAEQHRIVAKIEELFSELDKGIESLKTAQAQLKIYRQAVLKHAFEGKLTAQWREENKDKLETPEQLLARIKQGREAHYERQLQKWKAAVKTWEGGSERGKRPTKPKKANELPPLTESELAELPRLPDGWGWVRYGALTEIVRNGISERPKGEKGEKIFRISAVRPMNFNMDDYRHIENLDGSLDDYLLQKGDVVFTRYNGSRQFVGVCAEYRSEEKRVFPDKLIQTRVFSGYVNSSFIEKAVHSGASRRFIESRIRTTAGQSGVSGSDIKAIPIPLCPEAEQREVSQILESKLSIIDQLGANIEENLQKAEALRQSILKKAFSGQLVPQDPRDEPASVLLDRIRAEREKLEKNNHSKKTKKRKTRA